MPVTLDIGSSNLKLLWVKNNKVEKWATVPLPIGAVRDGRILKHQVVGEAIDSLFKSSNVSKSNVIVTVTGLSFTYRVLHLPWMKLSQLEEAIDRAAKKEIPLPLDEFYITWQIDSTGKDEIEVFLVGVPRNLINDLIKTLSIADIKPAEIDLKSLALSRAIGKSNALLVNFEADCFDIIVVAKGMPTILHSVTPKSEAATLEDNIGRLVDELTRTVDFYNITHADNPIGADMPLVLTGDLADSGSVIDSIRPSVGYQIEPIAPKLKYPADFPAARYASNIGLALKRERKTFARDATHFYDINLNLLSGKSRAERRPVPLSQRILPSVLIAGAALLFFLSMLYNQSQAETKRLNEEVGRLDRELMQTRLRADEAAKIEEDIKLLQSETATVSQQQQAVLGKNINDADILQLVVNATPPQAIYTRIEITSEQIIIEGEADTAATVMDYATALEAGKFSDVRVGKVGEITEGQSQNALSFNIVISR